MEACKCWTARIFHDSQSDADKSDVSAMAAMELINRHYVMTKVLERTGLAAYFRLFLWEVFNLAACAVRAQCRPRFRAMARGSSGRSSEYEKATLANRSMSKASVLVGIVTEIGRRSYPRRCHPLSHNAVACGWP